MSSSNDKPTTKLTYAQVLAKGLENDVAKMSLDDPNKKNKELEAKCTTEAANIMANGGSTSDAFRALAPSYPHCR